MRKGKPNSNYRPSILVVDDVPDNLRLLTGILAEEGYSVRLAPNGGHALATIEKDVPDLVLLDIMMPDIDGYDVCRRLKAAPRTCDTPVIFLSALDQAFDKVQAFRVGGVDYVSKPFQAEEVLARIRTHLTLREMRRTLQEKNAGLEREIRERKRAEKALAEANRELGRLAHIDPLTGAANRRRFDRFMNREWPRLARDRKPMSLLMCDLDYFKNYNDAYGHQAGDECLIKTAEVINHAGRRPADLAARYGGEEFVVALPDTDLAGAVRVAEEIQAGLRQVDLPHQASPVEPRLTVSIGAACIHPQSGKLNWDQLVAAADRALYLAKQRGRNRIECDEDTPSLIARQAEGSSS